MRQQRDIQVGASIVSVDIVIVIDCGKKGIRWNGNVLRIDHLEGLLLRFKMLAVILIEIVSYRPNINSLDRGSKSRGNNRSMRAHSMVREDTYHHQPKRAEETVRDYTMTLPASHGKHRSRRNGIAIHRYSSSSSANQMIFLPQIFVHNQWIREFSIPKMMLQSFATNMPSMHCFVAKV